MKIFDYLYAQRKLSLFNNSDEMMFYKKYKHLLEDNVNFATYLDIENFFDVIKANIIIKTIINKNNIDKIMEEEFLNTNFNSNEEIYEKIRERSLNLPYIKTEEQKILIPFFNKSTNLVYSRDFNKINEEPYINLKKKYAAFLVNPFETYKIDLFDSLFTKLIKVSEDLTTVAFYHYDVNTIFIINKQGYLDSFITLFDRHMKRYNKDHIIDRIRVIINFYYENNLTAFIYALYEQKLISYFVFRRLCKWKNI